MSKHWRPEAEPVRLEGGGGHGGGGLRWLVSYADMVTLLFVLFVVLFSMANIDKNKYAAVAKSLKAAIGSGGGSLIGTGTGTGTGDGSEPAPSFPNAPSHPDGAEPAPADALRTMGVAMKGDFQKDGRFTVYIGERGLVVSLLGSALFDVGRAEIRPEALPLLDAVAIRIKGLDNDISVEGFTDNQPIATQEFPSNWELSVRRATEVVRYFVHQHGLPSERFVAVGYGETRAVFSNVTEEGRAKNRRVDIVFLRNKQTISLGEEIKEGKR